MEKVSYVDMLDSWLDYLLGRSTGFIRLRDVHNGPRTDAGEADRTKWYHQVLGVGSDASWNEVREAYRRRAKLYHPDTGGSNERMLRLNAAYQAIKRAYGIHK